MAFLEISDLRKRFGSLEILKGINLSLDKGGFLVLVGPSGCGKSTLLNSIAGLEPITSGDIRIDGRRVADLHPSKRDIAMVFQSYALYPNMTVEGNISFGMEMRKIPLAERKAAIERVSKVLQIGHLLDRKPGQLSGGQRQRVAMGRALVRDPKLFLFDEPLSNLDAKLRVDMRTEIKRLHDTTGTSMVYVTHDQVEAMTLATKIAVMRDGEVQQFGIPSEIYNNPTTIFVADFMGSPAMNLLPARVENTGGSVSVVLARADGDELRLAVGEEKGKLLLRGPTPNLIVGIRPEALTDPAGADRHAKNVVEAECQIEVVEPAGSDTFAVTRLAGKDVVARLRGDALVHAGQKTFLAFNMDKAVFFDPATERRIA
ncbi:MAG: putative sugar transporter [Devosia sp.]|nr:putative sugar transporter [Devosia sp.]